MGSKFEAGEIGHTPYNYSKDAPICSCGNKGCLETYLANWQVINRVKKEQNLSLTYDDIIQKANNGDSYFRTLLLIYNFIQDWFSRWKFNYKNKYVILNFSNWRIYFYKKRK